MGVGIGGPLARVGGLSVGALGAAYLGAVLAMGIVIAVVPALLPLGPVIDVLLFVVLFVLVTWFRDDDPLPTGVFLALATGVAQLVIRAISELLGSGGVGGVILMMPAVALTLVVRAILVGAVCAALVWVARRVTVAVRPGWRPPAAGGVTAPAPVRGVRAGLFPKRPS